MNRSHLAAALAALPILIAAPAQAAPAASGPDWISGAIGIVILAVGGYYGVRYFRTRGVTAEQALRRLGVEFPQDAAAVTAAPKPKAPDLPPLPSLTALPEPAAAASAPPLAGEGAARLEGLTGAVEGGVFSLEAGTITIGRDGASTIPLPNDSTLSRRHARVEPRLGGDFVVVDEGSQNGTFVNGVRVTEQVLKAGDEIQVGSARFRFER